MKSFSLIYLKASFLSLLFFIITGSSLTAQVQFSKIKETYQDGEDFLESEDYKEALYLFLQVEQKGYMNPNLSYKIGICYLNLPGEETKAIPYLEEASKRITLKYKAKSIEEKQAPLHSLYYLGNAYRIDNQLAKALHVYDKFINHKGYDGTYNVDMVENEIKACERAKVIQDAPADVVWRNLGAPVNSLTSETNPVISGDRSVLVYLTSLKFYNAVYFTRRTETGWAQPENINPQIISDGDFYPTALSYDGKNLYLIKKTPKNFDIYVSSYVDGKWSVAKALNKNINSSSDETSATITRDGKVLYFVSNRGGGRGGFDIYRSVLGSDNQWQKPENLGKIINTKLDEATPSISPDGKVLYFSSKGHFNMGGFDVFYSGLEKDGSWSVPSNIGYPVNTTNDNVGFQVTADEVIGYISRIAPDGLGKEDIYEAKITRKFAGNTNSK